MRSSRSCASVRSVGSGSCCRWRRSSDWLGLLATAIFATTLVETPTAKGFAFGGMVGIRLLPALVLGPVAGVIADRFDRRYTMVVCDLLRFVLFASIPLGLAGRHTAALVWPGPAIAIFLMETITLVWIPAKDASIPNLVPRAKLEAANQLSLMVTYGVTPVLAALAAGRAEAGLQSGAIEDPPAAAAGGPAGAAVNAGSRLATAWWCGTASARSAAATAEHTPTRPTLLRQFFDGWQYIGKTPHGARAWCWASSAPSAPAASSSARPSSTPAPSAAATPPSTCCSGSSSSGWAAASRSDRG